MRGLSLSVCVVCLSQRAWSVSLSVRGLSLSVCVVCLSQCAWSVSLSVLVCWYLEEALADLVEASEAALKARMVSG